MIKYVALLRGIGPSNSNMHQHKLEGVIESLGHKRAQGVISSGNVVFETDRKDIATMEKQLEAAWVAKLGFTSTTIIRSQQQLKKLVAADPFAGLSHGPSSYLLVTFFKRPVKMNLKLPHQPAGKTYRLLSMINNTLFTSTDNTKVPTTDLMTWLERQFGKDITSRTWLSVGRILNKME